MKVDAEFTCNELNIWTVEAFVEDRRFCCSNIEFGELSCCQPTVIQKMISTAPSRTHLRTDALEIAWSIAALDLEIKVLIPEENNLRERLLEKLRKIKEISQ